MKTFVSFIILFSFSTGAMANGEATPAAAYDCKLIMKNGREKFEKTIFSATGRKEAKVNYLNSLIIKNGDIYEAKQSGGDEIELGIANSAPSLSHIVAVDCTATGMVIDLSLTRKE